MPQTQNLRPSSVIYLTAAGQTALADNLFLNRIRNKFTIDAAVILTTGSYLEKMQTSIGFSNQDIPIKYIPVTNPFTGNQDYVLLLMDLFQAVQKLIEDNKFTGVSILLNASGGTTKMMLLVSDIANLLDVIYPVKTIWGFKYNDDVTFTVKPRLDIQEICRKFITQPYRPPSRNRVILPANNEESTSEEKLNVQ